MLFQEKVNFRRKKLSWILQLLFTICKGFWEDGIQLKSLVWLQNNQLITQNYTPTFSYVPPSIFNGTIPVHIAQLPQTKPITVITWIGESVHYNRCGVTVEHFTHSTVEFIVCYWSPEWLILVWHRMNILSQWRFWAGVVVCVRSILICWTISRWRSLS